MARKISETLTRPVASIVMPKATSTTISARDCLNATSAVLEVAPVAAGDPLLALQEAGGDPDEERAEKRKVAALTQ